MSKVLFGRSGSLCGLRGPLLASAGSGRSKPRKNKTLVQVQSDTYLCRSILSEPFLAILLFFPRLLDQADRVLAYLRGPVFTSPISKRAVNRSYPSCTRIRSSSFAKTSNIRPLPEKVHSYHDSREPVFYRRNYADHCLTSGVKTKSQRRTITVATSDVIRKQGRYTPKPSCRPTSSYERCAFISQC